MFLKTLVEVIRIIKNFKSHMVERAWDSESSMVPFGLFGLISLPLFFFVNLYFLDSQAAPISYHWADLALRALCSLLCLLLSLKDYLPNKFRCYLPLIWYAAILFFMPFFATFMTLQHHFSAAWILNALSILILTILLVDWFVYAFLLILGVSLATLTYFLVTQQAFPIARDTQPLNTLDIFLTYAASIIMGVIFSRRKDLIEDAKLKAVRAVGANIAHELRTPIVSIEAGISGAKSYLPSLLKAYTLAKQHKINVPEISSQHMDTLLNLLDELEEETRYSNIIIDMLLVKSKQRGFTKTSFVSCSISHCISEALRRYPFKEGEEKLINWDNSQDFHFHGEPLLILHVFFNLIKNALYFIEQEGKGKIQIRYEKSIQYNIVHFKDTAKGIPAHVISRLFERFYSYSNRGTGLGLAFCKMVMRGLEGDIKCKSIYGEFADFILYFPRKA